MIVDTRYGYDLDHRREKKPKLLLYYPFSHNLRSPMGLSKKERKQLITKISQASGVAQYALEAKMSDEEIIQAANNLEIFALIKNASNYNRYCQGQKTAEANAKLKEFLNLNNSEIYQAGQWLLRSLSKQGKERSSDLLTHNLVHKDDYNQAVSELKAIVETMGKGNHQLKDEARKIIQTLEQRNDSLRKDLGSIKQYIINNYSQQRWQQIEKDLNGDKSDEK